MEKWFIQNKKADFNAIAQTYGIDPVIARLICNRDIAGEEKIERYLYPEYDKMHDKCQLKDLQKAAQIIMEKVNQGKTMRIISDYDVDGVISNYVLYVGLSKIGGKVDYEIPNRVEDGYGINEALIKKAHDQGIDTIITCDNGIAAIDQIAYGKQLGMTIIVTDHHEIPYQSGENESKIYLSSTADAIINPKQIDCDYPFKDLCGAGVAFKLIESLYELNNIAEDEAKRLIEFVAIATVCDVVDLIDENRIIVKKGLELLNQTTNIGLQALIQACNLHTNSLSTYHLGFVIGPCINASGRLDSAKRGLELLLCQEPGKAQTLAMELKELNDQRKDLTKQGVEEAFLQVEKTAVSFDKVLVIYLPNCHESLAGIIAGRVREKYYKPVIVITKSKDGLKGSGRSIESYHMFEEISKCKNLLTKYGGHKMAAGLSLTEENLHAFRQKINEVQQLTEDDLSKKVLIDVPMPIDYISTHLIEQINLLEPFGKANPKPLFAEKGWNLIKASILGKNQNVLKFIIENNKGTMLEALYFGDIQTILNYLDEKYGAAEVALLMQGRHNNVILDCTYYPDINEFRGHKAIQVIIQNYK